MCNFPNGLFLIRTMCSPIGDTQKGLPFPNNPFMIS